MTFYIINTKGRAEIEAIVSAHSKYLASEDAVSAYAEDAERSMNENGDGRFEIRAMHSRTGNSLPFSVSDDGFDAEEMSE